MEQTAQVDALTRKTRPQVPQKKLSLRALMLLGSFLALVTLAFVLIFGELALQVVDFYQYHGSRAKEAWKDYDKYYSDEPEEAYVYGHQANRSVTLRKRTGWYHASTNSQGFRSNHDYGTLKESVVFLGDSIIEGSGVDDSDTLDSVFEAKTKVPALNFGVGSYNTFHELYYLKAKLKPEFHAKLVYLGFCLNDIEDNTYLRRFDPSVGNWRFYKFTGVGSREALDPEQEKKKGRGWIRWLGIQPAINWTKENSHLVSYILDRMPAAWKGKLRGERWGKESVTPKGFAATRAAIQELKDFLDEKKIPLIVILFPTSQQVRFSYSQGDRAQDEVIRILNEFNIPYIDLFDTYQKLYQIDSRKAWFSDDFHPEAETNRYFIDTVIEQSRKTLGRDLFHL